MPLLPDPPVPCHKCGVKNARVFVTQFENGVKSNLHLCEGCAMADTSGLGAHLREAKDAKCVYCGGSPCSGGTDLAPTAQGYNDRRIWRCYSCGPEYYARMQTEMEGLPPDLSQEEQLKVLAAAHERVEAHMRRFVGRRDN